jgi:ribosomal protein S18 acetylase RimI-like enzyme
MAEFVLRPAIDADRDAIAAIWHESAGLPTVGPAKMPSLASLRARVDIEMESSWEVTVAEQHGNVVGFLAIERDDAVLDELFLLPEVIGQGIGGALLAQAKAAMPAGFTLFTRATNVRARRFYEKAGLVALRTETHARDGDLIVFYGWSLGPSTLG